MNSNFSRALGTVLVALTGVAPAMAQFDWDTYCIDPSNTAPYSNPFGILYMSTNLFGAGIGVVGTVTYGGTKSPSGSDVICPGASVPVVGRIGFTLGDSGSVQDNDNPEHFGGDLDDRLRLTAYMNPGTGITSGGGISYARIRVLDPAGNNGAGDTKDYLYGENGLTLAFSGASGRYMYTEGTVNGGAINVRCVIDVIGDAAKVNWTITNNTTSGSNGSNARGIGLWFGQEVWLRDSNFQTRGVRYQTSGGEVDIPYITVPGRKPLTVHERFPGDVATSVPDYVNFSMNQTAAFGLQVVNSPNVKSTQDPNGVSDQSQVDEFVLGETPFLIDGRLPTTNPTFGDFIFNAVGNGNADAASLDIAPAFLQKWQPTVIVPQGGSRTIVAYYRSTNFDSSYSNSFDGYTAAVDTPKSLSTAEGDPTSLDPNPFTIRVNVDNTGGFSVVDKFIDMQDVAVTLQLPNGLSVAGNPSQRSITKYINRVPSHEMNFVDFQVQADANTFGELPYSVTISPQPGFGTKTVSGTINVATSPRLLIRQGANLVAPPWTFNDNTWSSVLGLDINQDFQAYTWDPQTQQYVPQTNPERGKATWIISNSDLGYQQLGGGPTKPTDEFPDPTNFYAGGAPVIRLRRGWNLVGNPYNYAFVLGQILGVPLGSTTALTYQDLVNQGYMDGAFAYYDQALHGYSFTQGDTARLQPNYGYWVYANQDFDLQFPPLYDLFIRSGLPTQQFRQGRNNWRLQLSAATRTATDTSTYLGVVRNGADVVKLRARKAPMSPNADAVRAFVTGTAGEMAQELRSAAGKQTFQYTVSTKAAGPVTITWPNLKEIPTNLAVKVTDTTTRKTINPRTSAGYSFTAAARTSRTFTVEVTPQGTVAQRIGTTSATQIVTGSTQKLKINYFLSGRGTASVRILQKNAPVATVLSDADAVAGSNTVLWSLMLSSGDRAPKGTYTVEVTATGEGGDTTKKLFNVTVR